MMISLFSGLQIENPIHSENNSYSLLSWDYAKDDMKAAKNHGWYMSQCSKMRMLCGIKFEGSDLHEMISIVNSL